MVIKSSIKFSGIANSVEYKQTNLSLYSLTLSQITAIRHDACFLAVKVASNIPKKAHGRKLIMDAA